MKRLVFRILILVVGSPLGWIAPDEVVADAPGRLQFVNAMRLPGMRQPHPQGRGAAGHQHSTVSRSVRNSVPPSADGAFISQKLEMDSADYLARQLQLPTFLVHVDVEAKKVFWSTIQLDQKVLGEITAGNAGSRV